MKATASPDEVGHLAIAAGAKPGREVALYRCGYEQGCDDMRAACLRDVVALLESTGLRDQGSDSIVQRVKAAIEGATP